MPAIVVLVKNVPDTWSKPTLDEDFTLHREGVDEVIDEVNEFAMEQALRLKEAGLDAEVIALSVGPSSAETALRKALAMGADKAILVNDPALAGSDVMGTAWTIHNALQQIPDVLVVFAGSASSDGAMGALPAILSEYRQQPALTHVKALSVEDSRIVGTIETNEGEFQVQATMPAIVSVTDKADKPRFPNFKGIMAAKKAEIAQFDVASIGVAPEQVGLAHAATAVTAAHNRPERSAGEVLRGEPAEVAKKLVDYLEQEKLLGGN